MPNPLVLTIACLVLAVGLAILIDAIVPRRGRTRPRCAGCGADARGAIWRDAARCNACNADLTSGQAIRWGFEMGSKRMLAVGATLVAAAAATGCTDRWLAQRRLQWRDLLPASWILSRLTPNHPDRDPALASLQRRAFAGVLGTNDARQVLVQLLLSPKAELSDWELFGVVGWDRAAIERWLEDRGLDAIEPIRTSDDHRRIDLVASGLGGGNWLEGEAEVQSVEIDGRPVSLIHDRGGGGSGGRSWSDPAGVISPAEWYSDGKEHTVAALWTLGVSLDAEWRTEKLFFSGDYKSVAELGDADGLPFARIIVEVVETVMGDASSAPGEPSLRTLRRELRRWQP